MTRILVLYASTHGHTGRVADHIGDVLRRNGLAARVRKLGETAIDPSEFDAYVLAGSVHAGHHQHELMEWIAEHRIPTREVHIVGKKWEVDCDVYLEDAPHNLEELVAQRPDRVVARYVRPWNDPVDGAVDIDDWDQFMKLVDSVGS